MSTSKEAKKRLQYKEKNNRSKIWPIVLAIFGGAVIVAGSIVLTGYLFCNKNPTPPSPVEKNYTIKTDGTDEYFNVNDDTQSLTGWKIGGETGESDKDFYAEKYTGLIIPTGITSISQNAFNGCISFRDSNQPIKLDFHLSPSFTSIGGNAFWDCVGITSVDFSGNDASTTITSIGAYAFYGCKLSNVTSGAGITEITPSNKSWGDDFHVFGLSTFVPNLDYTKVPLYASGCGCLVYGTFAPTGSATTSVCSDAFSGCGGITAVDFSNLTGAGKINIGDSAFASCLLSDIVPGAGIDDRTPNGWGSLHIFCLETFVPDYTNDAISLSNSGCGCLVYGTFAPTDATTSIGSYAFYHCAGITAVDFSHYTLSSIGEQAFVQCLGIHSYTFASTQKYDSDFTIGSYAFLCCASSGKIICNNCCVSTNLLSEMIAHSSSWMMAGYWTTAIS